MKRPTFILGTRPEVIKLSLLIRACEEQQLNPRVISTGQHRDLLPQTFLAFNTSPDIDLDTLNNAVDPISYSKQLQIGLLEHIDSKNTSYIIVQGDTASSLAGAKVGQRLGIPVGHVEAGVRSHNLREPWPEERFRKEITEIAIHHFAPTKTNRENLLAEKVQPKNILVTGNTVIDAIQYVAEGHQHVQDRTILVSVHRRENITTFAKEMETLLTRIIERFSDYTFKVIEHPNPDAKKLLRNAFKSAPNIVWEQPMSYPNIIKTLQEVSLILTDSGGFQEEAAELKTPIVVLREYTDRPESIGKGAFLAKRDLKTCIHAINTALTSEPEKINPFGPKGASKKIATFLHSYLEKMK